MLVAAVDLLARVINIVIIVNVILSYFMSPYHPVRMALDRIVEPLLAPIRRIVPPVQTIDFSPFILLILIELIRVMLVSLLS
jgi:YggT family protein